MTPSALSEISQSAFEKEFSGEAQMPQPSQAMAERFEQLMANAEPCLHGGSTFHETIVGKAISAQEAQWQNVPNDLLYMMQNSHALPQETPMETMNRFTNEGVYMGMEVAQMNADLNIKIVVVKTTKSSIESLMKNQ